MCLPEVKGPYLLGKRFSQDPIEKHFGQQCSHGGRCNNLTVKALLTAQSLCVQGSQAMLPVRGNYNHERRLIPQQTIANTPLPNKQQPWQKNRLTHAKQHHNNYHFIKTIVLVLYLY